MSDPIRALRQELSRQLAEQGAQSPRVEHLRWQLASFERQARRAVNPPSTEQPSLRDAAAQR